jgi:hypothetical protein
MDAAPTELSPIKAPRFYKYRGPSGLTRDSLGSYPKGSV